MGTFWTGAPPYSCREWKAAAPRGCHPKKRGPPPGTATWVIEAPEWRCGNDFPGCGHTREARDHVLVKGFVGGGFPPFLWTVGAHQEGGDPVSQVRDLIKVLVCGGVAVQFAQFVGELAGAEGFGGV